ncbi:MAG TPA: hypothetical protein DDW52_10230 [Planctomycetaceae bacterium]|nr:hypothetical protein [Planctomycetaceae bacterium]
MRNTTVNLTFDETDATCRGSGGYRQNAVTVASLEVTGDAVKDKADASFVAIEAAAVAKTTLPMLVMDGDRTVAESDGWQFDGQIFSWEEAQGYEDIVVVSFTIKPARGSAPALVSGPIGV